MPELFDSMAKGWNVKALEIRERERGTAGQRKRDYSLNVCHTRSYDQGRIMAGDGTLPKFYLDHIHCPTLSLTAFADQMIQQCTLTCRTYSFTEAGHFQRTWASYEFVGFIRVRWYKNECSHIVSASCISSHSPSLRLCRTKRNSNCFIRYIYVLYIRMYL